MAERRPLVVITGRVQELPAGDTLPGGGGAAALKVVYTDENLTIATNTQATGHGSIKLRGTSKLKIEGTGTLALL